MAEKSYCALNRPAGLRTETASGCAASRPGAAFSVYSSSAGLSPKKPANGPSTDEMPGMEADGQLRLAEDGSVLDNANA